MTSTKFKMNHHPYLFWKGYFYLPSHCFPLDLSKEKVPQKEVNNPKAMKRCKTYTKNLFSIIISNNILLSLVSVKSQLIFRQIGKRPNISGKGAE